MKKLTINSLETFKALRDYIFVSGNEVTVHDNELYNDLSRAAENRELINKLKRENEELKNQFAEKPDFEGDQEQLRKNLEDKDKTISNYQSQVKNFEQKIQKLQDENRQLQQKVKSGSKSSKQMEELKTRIENLTEEKKELSRVNDGLKQEHKQINAKRQEMKNQVAKANAVRDKTREQLDKSLRLSGYTRLLKEALILRSFIDEPFKRQFQLEKEFGDVMSPPSVRRHLYHLTEVGLLIKPFSGQYHLPKDMFSSYDYNRPKEIMKEVVTKIMGADLGFFIQTLFGEPVNDY